MMYENYNPQAEIYSYMVPPELIAGSITAVSQATAALANRKQNEIKQQCGRKPLFGKEAKTRWNKCTADVSKKYDPELIKKEQERLSLLKLKEEQSKTKNKTKFLWSVVGGGGVLIILIFAGSILYKKQTVVV